jgi:hypothetical protein
MMDQQQLEDRALLVRWHDDGRYRGKNLCQACLMDKANISTQEDRLTFDLVWHQWITMLNRDRCAVCGELKETILLPTT